MSLGLLQDHWVLEEKLDVFLMSSEIQGLIIWLRCFNFKESERKKKKILLAWGLKNKELRHFIASPLMGSYILKES